MESIASAAGTGTESGVMHMFGRKKKETEPSPYMVDLRNINKSYQMGSQTLQVLYDVSLQVKKGEYLAILGPSGSGKSTLMNTIGCMDVPDTGEYYLDGIAVHKANDRKMTKIRNEKIGFIFQKYHLIPSYTVMQNIIMPLLTRGEGVRDAEKQSAEIIEMLGLAERTHHKPNELSGGQQQRVAIARALVGNPGILLADEPTGALDRESGQEVLKLFHKLHEMGNTILMITHDLNVAQHAERIVYIVDGRLYEESPIAGA